MASPQILVIAPTRIGDAILATSILAHIENIHPDAEVTLVTSTLAAPLFAGYPQLKRALPVVKQTYNRHWLKVWRATVGTFWQEVWDLRASIVTFAVRTNRRHWFRPPPAPLPKVQQYAAAFATGPLPAPRLWPLAAHMAEAARLMPEGERFLIFAPIANWPPKEWPLAHYITLARALLAGEYAGYRPVLICAPDERPRAAAFAEAFAQTGLLDLSRGNHHLLTIYACMQRAAGFVGNDSGLMHMASAAGIKTVGLFGPTPNIGADYPHTRYLYAEGKDLAGLSPATVHTQFVALMNT
ncbi:MAG: glycosyltransferase family 9 protein [Alphaproteobacteria bacterium]|nr:glycosyltransferase family 9 protein [Alphaproteobacteria bacterium]